MKRLLPLIYAWASGMLLAYLILVNPQELWRAFFGALGFVAFATAAVLGAVK